MLKKKLSILLSLACVLSSMVFVTPSHAATTIEVWHDGNHQYVGTTSDVIQDAIDAAQANDTVYIHAGTYNMVNPITLRSGVNIQGEGINKTIIKGTEGVCQGEDVAYLTCVGTKNADGTISYKGNIDISGLTFKSTSRGAFVTGENGDGSKGRHCIFVRYCENITVHDCSAPKWIYNDFFRAKHSKNLTMYNCYVVTGHAAAYFFNCSHCVVHHNDILMYTNAGIRGDGTTKNENGNNEYYNNTIWCESGGQSAFEFQNDCDGTLIYKNIAYDFSKATSGKAVVENYAGSAKGTVKTYDNVWWNSSGGIQMGDDGSNKNQDGAGGIKDHKHWEDPANDADGVGYGSKLADLNLEDPNPWWSGINFTSQQNLGTSYTGTAVNIEFDLTPLLNNTVSVVGFADSSTTINAYSSMPIQLLLYSNGYFYAVKGWSYTRSAYVPYSQDTTYHIKMVANMTAKTYDVFITPSGGSQVQLANDYAFRGDSPATDDVGKICLNSDVRADDTMVANLTISTGSTPPPPASQPVTFNPTADSYVRGGTDASCNFGDCPELVVKYEPDTGLSYFRKSYLKFNYSSVSSVTSAKLRVYLSASDGDASTIKVYGNSTESWSESTITWNNAPAATTSIGSINVGTTAGQWYEIDVTSYVQNNMSDKVISLELINEGPHAEGNKATFNSKEASSNKPELVITP